MSTFARFIQCRGRGNAARTAPLVFGVVALISYAFPVAAQFGERREPAWASLTGFVWDSTAASPLSGARVMLIGAGIEGTTAPDGTFRIDSIPPGTYPVSFSHPRFTGTGLTLPARPVQFLPNGESSVDLSVPSVATLLATACITGAEDPTTGAVVGYVTDAGTGIPLPTANVSLKWYGQESEVAADWQGIWLACGVPRNAQVIAEVTFPGRESKGFILRGEGDPFRRRDVQLSSGVDGIILGTVLDSQTEAPVAEAEVTLPDADRTVVTDADGHFMVTDLKPGPHEIVVSHLAYGDDSGEVRVPDDRRILDLTVRLAPRVIELEGIVVEPTSPRVRARMAQGTRFGGMDFSEIQDVLPRITDMQGLFRAARVPGLLVRETPGSGICVELGRVRGRSDCTYPELYVDGVKINDVSSYLSTLSPERVERFQVLSAVEAGVLYGAGSQNGVIVIRTRAGRVR